MSRSASGIPQESQFALKGNEPALLRLWRIYWGLAFLQAALALARAGFGVSGGASELFFKSMLLALTVGLTLACGWLALEAWLNWNRVIHRLRWAVNFISHPKAYCWLFIASLLVSLSGLFLVTLTPELTEPFTRSLFERLQVFFLLAAGLGLQTLVALLIFRHGDFSEISIENRKVFFVVLGLYGLMFGMWGLIQGTVVQQARQLVGWNDPGPPLLELQTALAFFAGLVLLVWMDRTGRSGRTGWLARLSPARVDLELCLLIWLTAVIVWGLTPIQPNWFLTDAVYPSKDFFPSSDARVYDSVAQNALTGSGYRFENTIFIRRPLHALYLTVLHLLGGQSYSTVVWLQILALAWLPALIYLLVKSLSNRAAGLMAALLVLFREANSIRIAGSITTSNVKVLMVDLPMAFMLVVFFLLTTAWLKDHPQDRLWAALAGMALGLGMLIRLESAAAAAAALFVMATQLRQQKQQTQIKPWRMLGRQLAFFAIGLGLALAPWMARNYAKTGMVFLTEPDFRFALILQRFVPLPEPSPTLIAPQQVETQPIPSAQLTAAPQPTTGQAPPATPVKKTGKPAPTPVPTKTPLPLNLEQAARATLLQSLRDRRQLALVGLAHLLNSQMQPLLTLPITWRGFDALAAFIGRRSLEQLGYDCCSAIGYTRQLPYWPKWEGSIARQSIVPLLLNLLLLAVGIQHAWRRLRWLGLLPALSAFAYVFANALFRNSGGRYILPVDWVVIVYFSIGAIQTVRGLWRYFFGRSPRTNLSDEGAPAASPGRKASPLAWALAGLLMAAALAIPLMEAVFPVRYTDQRQAGMLETLLRSEKITMTERDLLQSFLENGAFAQAGRVLYPQYYQAHMGSLGKEYGPIAPKPYRRLAFNLAGPLSLQTELALQERPERIQHAADGLLIACPNSYTIALATFGEGQELENVTLATNLPEEMRCPRGIESAEP